MKRIAIDPITRLEGHGKITIFLNDEGAVENAYLQIPELRGFERVFRSRRFPGLSRASAVCDRQHTTWPRVRP
jgi:F420-non-reducing hydrogenase large subunit